MSVQVVETPYLFSWARNMNRLRLLCNSTGLENYAVAARVTVWVNDYNQVKEYQSEAMVFHADSEGYVSVPLYLLAGFIPQPDLPDGTPFQLLTNAVLKYQVSYAEMYGSPVPTVQTWQSDMVRYALCGEVVERYARLNLPDWDSGQVKMIAGSEDVFWLIGEPTGQTVNVQAGQPVYLYGLWYSQNKAFTETLKLTVDVTTYSDNGTTGLTSLTLSPTNGSVFRLDVSPSAIGADADSTLYYTVDIATSGGNWNRTYTLHADRWRARTLLLQSKYGVLVPWLVDELKRELTIEGESLTAGRQHYTDLKSVFETYTATTPLLTAEEARRLAQCLSGRYHYIRSGGAWVRVVVEPGTFAVLSEPENMVRVEFKLRFCEDQQENLCDAPRSQAMTFNYYDLEEQYAAFDSRTAAINNELL